MTSRDLPKPAPPVPFYEIPVKNIGLEVAPGAQVADGWHTWVASDKGFKEAKFDGIELEGRRRQGIFSEEPYDAALFQTVEVRPDLAVEFEMKFRVDPTIPGTERPAGLIVGLGIHPKGGTDPRDDAVQWALRDLRYSQLVTARVISNDHGNAVTLFVRSVAFIPGSGTAAGAGSSNMCLYRCQTVQFARTYLLLPPGADQALWERGARTAYNNRWTMGGSADDAGIASALLLIRPIVKIVNPWAWGAPPLGAPWFSANYPPGVTVETLAEDELDP